MPIYAYKCSACGFAKDVLQKMSDTPLTVCLSCGAETFTKQLTAAGFQLKGSGWYVTDFRDGGGKKGADKGDKGDKDGGSGGEAAADQGSDKAGAASSDAPAGAAPAKSSESTAASAKAAPAAAAPAPASAPAAKSD